MVRSKKEKKNTLNCATSEKHHCVLFYHLYIFFPTKSLRIPTGSFFSFSFYKAMAQTKTVFEMAFFLLFLLPGLCFSSSIPLSDCPSQKTFQNEQTSCLFLFLKCCPGSNPSRSRKLADPFEGVKVNRAFLGFVLLPLV